MKTDALYHQHLMDHYRFSHNRGEIVDPDFCAQDHNPSCGDRVCMMGRYQDGMTIKEVFFTGSGCVLSQACASMLAELACGKTSEQILALTRQDIITLVGMELGPTRIKCALLPLHVLQDALRKHDCQ